MHGILLRSRRRRERLRKDVLSALHVQNTNDPQNSALNRFVTNTISALSMAGVGEKRLRRVTLRIARKFVASADGSPD